MTFLSRHRNVILGSALVVAASLAQAQDNGMYPPDDPAAANMVSDNGQPDPPQRVARIAVLQGNASFESAAMSGFAPAELNYPMTTGDRLYAGEGMFAEVQTDGIAARLGQNTDVTVVALTDAVVRFGVAAGSLHLREFSIDPGTTVELDTPNVAIHILQAGDIRVDVDPDRDLSYLTVVSGQVEVDGNNFEQTLGAGSSLSFNGLNPLEVAAAAQAQVDGLDDFSADRDRGFLAAEQDQNQYLNAGTIGAGDLQGNGDWDNDADYGAVWYPTVAAGWAPYQYGHWVWIAPWGWTWVEGESWGFAPFHYGRWIHVGSRWGWLPGPPVVHPVYAPALVVFVGGRGFAGGATGWFPLGPHEVYTPPFHVSPLYMNRVNVSNMPTRDARNVRAVYGSHALRPEYTPGMPGHEFAYRDQAVVMSGSAFAAGRPVVANQIHLSHDELAAAPVAVRPMAAPARSAMMPGANRPPAPGDLPEHTDRPVLDQRNSGAVGGSYVRPALPPATSSVPVERVPERNTGGDNGGGAQSRGGVTPNAPVAPLAPTRSYHPQPDRQPASQERPFTARPTQPVTERAEPAATQLGSRAQPAYTPQAAYRPQPEARPQPQPQLRQPQAQPQPAHPQPAAPAHPAPADDKRTH